jgi:formate hydrogenlyase subunit 3/multisubunit Na+/H+ antiporter MnhD subunit
MNNLGKPLIIVGLFLVVAGILICFAPKLPTWLGRLPGDITFRRGNFSFYFPLATCLLFSAVLSFIIWLIRK